VHSVVNCWEAFNAILFKLRTIRCAASGAKGGGLRGKLALEPQRRAMAIGGKGKVGPWMVVVRLPLLFLPSA
jgi:hypothetical protein